MPKLQSLCRPPRVTNLRWAWRGLSPDSDPEPTVHGTCSQKIGPGWPQSPALRPQGLANLVANLIKKPRRPNKRALGGPCKFPDGLMWSWVRSWKHWGCPWDGLRIGLRVPLDKGPGHWTDWPGTCNQPKYLGPVLSRDVRRMLLNLLITETQKIKETP